ncbi:flagellar assembly protein FliW [Amantichitinum ursilacus]|uniref:Flagellar assembly factor FliW n=1 Tax=Amantichitinum ursilacus TaxID=857265 RepID=A0A0N0GNL3_9NEIS|nr:flagellar assembly protein FliW [Amantichitinum ursilacus]KPC52942.1 Flagellar assembly factor FliW [Amantichitinum ursilacus]
MTHLNTRFGEVDIDPANELTFPLGLPGFETFTRFVLLHEDKPNPTVRWLQSLDDTSVALSVVPASDLGLDYQIVLTDEEVALLQLERQEDVQLLLILSRRNTHNGLDGAIAANTFAPVILNVAARRGFQKTGLRADIVFRN